MSPDAAVERTFTWRDRFRFSSIRRPFQSQRDSNAAHFRFTISDRHEDDRLQRAASNPAIDRDPEPEVWTLSPTDVFGRGDCTPSATTNCFRSPLTKTRAANAVRFDNSCSELSTRPRRLSDLSGTEADGASDPNCKHRTFDVKQQLTPDYAARGATAGRRHSSISASDSISKSGISNRLPIDDSISSPTGSDVVDRRLDDCFESNKGTTAAPPQDHKSSCVASNDITDRKTTTTATTATAAGDKSKQSVSSATSLGVKTSNLMSSVSQQIKQRDRSERREMRATIRMAVIIGVFGAMWIGFFVLYVANGVRPGYFPVHPVIEAFLFWLGYVNSTVNPILYAVFNADFRRAFTRIITGCCCCCDRQSVCFRTTAAGAQLRRGSSGRRPSNRRNHRRGR
jgi:hypothetical protein